MMTPRVSILIPTYNRARYLRDALSSALAQTYADIDILVLDDASSDDTPSIVAQYARDSRIKYLRHEKNRGIAANWRSGIEASDGDLFCILHDDDVLEVDFVTRLVEPMKDDRVILAFCDHWVMDDRGRRLDGATEVCSRRFKRNLLQQGLLSDFACSALVDASVPVGATVFRRSRVQAEFIDEQAKGAIDAWLLYQCAKTGYEAYYVSERLMNYRCHADGMSVRAPLSMAEGQLFCCQRILSDPEMERIHSSIRGKMRGVLTEYGIDLLTQGRRAEARGALKQSLGLGVSHRALVAYGLACGGGAGSGTTAVLRKLLATLRRASELLHRSGAADPR